MVPKQNDFDNSFLGMNPLKIVEKFQDENPPDKWCRIDQALDMHLRMLFGEEIVRQYPNREDIRKAIVLAATIASSEKQESWKMRWEGWLAVIRMVKKYSLRQDVDIIFLAPEKLSILKIIKKAFFGLTFEQLQKKTKLPTEKLWKILKDFEENGYAVFQLPIIRPPSSKQRYGMRINPKDIETLSLDPQKFGVLQKIAEKDPQKIPFKQLLKETELSKKELEEILWGFEGKGYILTSVQKVITIGERGDGLLKLARNRKL